jgi:hypothetical protein
LLNEKQIQAKQIETLAQEKEDLKKYTTRESLSSPHSQSREAWETHLLALASESGFQANRIKAKKIEGNSREVYGVTIEGTVAFEKFVRFMALLIHDETYPRVLSCDIRSNPGFDMVTVTLDLCTELAPKTASKEGASIPNQS